MKKEKFFSAKNVAYLGVLTALVIVLQLWGSAIPIGAAGLNLSFVLLPIALGAILLGPVSGMFLGFVFGLVVYITGAMGWSMFTYYLFASHPVITFFICMVKGGACGFLGGVLYKLIHKKNKYVAVFVSAGAVPIINTGIFILGCLCITGTIRGFAAEYMELNSENIMYIIIVGLVTINFFIEFAINLVCAPALYTVNNVVEKQILRSGKRYKTKKKVSL